MHYSINSSFQKISLMYDTDKSSISTELKTKMIHYKFSIKERGVTPALPSV